MLWPLSESQGRVAARTPKMKSPAFQFYPKQFLGDDAVLGMEWDARAMHWHLCCISWQQDPPGSIPDDMALIRRWLGLTPGESEADSVWNRVKPQILAAWSLKDGRWYQSGMVKAWVIQQTRRDAIQVRYKTSTNERQAPMKIEVEEVVAVDFELKKPTDAELIYCEYPRKIGKRSALKAIGTAIDRLLGGEKGAPFDSRDDVVVFLTQRVRDFCESPAGQAGSFTPHPATWFNRSSYLDEIDEWNRGEVNKAAVGGHTAQEGPELVVTAENFNEWWERDKAARRKK